MNTIRQQRVAELLYEELSIMVSNELDDPKLSLVIVTRVEISRDLRNAKVFVNHQQEDVTPREVLKHLRRAMPYLRSQIAVRCSMRMVPELNFAYDDIPAKAARVDELLRSLAQEREQEASTSNAAKTEPSAEQ